jgi:hypothetical protein
LRRRRAYPLTLTLSQREKGKKEGIIMDTDMTAPGVEDIVPKHAPLGRIAYGLQVGAGPVWMHARALCSALICCHGKEYLWRHGIEIYKRPAISAVASC